MTLKGEENSLRDEKLGFRKQIPWDLNWGAPWKAPQLWFQDLARQKGPESLARQWTWSQPVWTVLKQGGEEGTGEWEADSYSSWCSIFPPCSLAYQIGPESQRSRIRPRTEETEHVRSITRTKTLPSLSHTMQTLRWTRRQHLRYWAYIHYDAGSMLYRRVPSRADARLQKVSQRVESRFGDREALLWTQVLPLNPAVDLGNVLSASLAPQFLYDNLTNVLDDMTWHCNNYLIIIIS